MQDEELVTLCRRIGLQVYAEHKALGLGGRERTARNVFGDIALVGDVQAEKTVLAMVRKAGLSVRAITEEHGEFQIGDDPQFTLFVDGLDGSAVYENATPEQLVNGSVQYSTMFGLSLGVHPTYGDGIVSVMVEHPTGRLIMARRGHGAWVEDLKTGRTRRISTQTASLSSTSVVYCDSDYPRWAAPLRATFVWPLAAHNIHTEAKGATSWHYASLLTGGASATLEWSRKGNLEMAIAHLLVIEAGGTMCRLDGTQLGWQLYDEVPRDDHEMHYFIVAANNRVVIRLMQLLTRPATI